jgi:nitroreductase
METIKGIETRRSIRKFKAEPVTKETLVKLIDTTKYAPSWKNSQTSRYIAITNVDVKKRIAEECVMGHQGNMNIITSAPVLMVQTTVNARSGYNQDGTYTTSKGTHWQSYDAGISGQTFCLTAHEYGLGTVIMGIFDESRVAEVLSLDSSVSVSALIALGYPDIDPVAPPRKDTSEVLTIVE